MEDEYNWVNNYIKKTNMEKEINEVLEKLNQVINDIEDNSRVYETHYRILNEWYIKLKRIENEIRIIQTRQDN